MRKISNVDDAIEKFKIAANDNYECSYNGNYRKANRAYDNLMQIKKYVTIQRICIAKGSM